MNQELAIELDEKKRAFEKIVTGIEQIRRSL